MPLETASHIASLNATNPASGDAVAQADDHLRLIKSVLTTDFATINAAITATPTEINSLGGILKTQLDRAGSLTTAGTATAYTLTSNTVFASLSAMNGKAVIFKPHVTSGATPTLNVDGLGAVALKSIAGTVIPTGALLIGGRYAVTYNDSATEFVVHGIFGVLPSTQFSGAVAVSAGGLSVTGGALVNTGGLTVTAGGLVISASGAAITGNSSVTGTLGVSSDFAINTNKFTVAGATGNTLNAGTLDVTGNLAVNTNKFTVDASTGNTAVVGTLGVTGAVSGSAAILSSSATAGVGYSTGAGGTVTQATNKSTGVTLNKMCGQITMNAAALASGGVVSFTLNSTGIAITDFVMVNHVSGGSVGLYTVGAQAGNNAAGITIRNSSAGTLSEAIVIQFAVFKGVTT